MFLFDSKHLSIRHKGLGIELRGLLVKAAIAGIGEVELKLNRTEIISESKEQTKTELYYADHEELVQAKLALTAQGGLLSINVQAELYNQTVYHVQRTFAAEGGIRIIVKALTGLQGLLATSRHKDWWTRPHFETDLTMLPSRTQALLWEANGSYGYMLPICDTHHRCDIAASPEGLAIHVSAMEGGHTKLAATALVIGAGTNPYDLAAEAVHAGFAVRNTGGGGRERKQYPEILDYLGWCSWDAFYLDVDETGLINKAQELNDMGLPVRWFMLDDGWSDVNDRKLAGFEADPLKFPGGLKQTVSKLKTDYGIRWVGAWHNIVGYWGGVDPKGKAFEEARASMRQTRGGTWIPQPEQSFAFWQIWHSRLQHAGIDFIKVDNQSSLNNYMGQEQSIVKTTIAAHAALEASVSLYFNGQMINCMGMASENVWHRPKSSVSRSSNDFLPKITDGFGEHALQNSYNSVYHGPFYWGDWDMFWTAHHDALPHMVLRAISGGPIYFSDGPGRTDPDKIWPLIYSDGRIIRCAGIGQPTLDWLTVNPERIAKPFKVWNVIEQNADLKKKNGSHDRDRIAAVGVFHIHGGNSVLYGDLGNDDIPDMNAEAYIVYDYFQGNYTRLQSGERMPIQIVPLEAQCYLFLPEQPSFTAIGLTDKLISADAIRAAIYDHITNIADIELKDAGTFSFVSSLQPQSATVNGRNVSIETVENSAGLYRIVCKAETEAIELDKPQKVTVHIHFAQ